MNVPLRWLKEYVSVEASPQDIATALTCSGTEVTGIHTIGVSWERFLAAEVIAVVPHPEALGLMVCQVHDGQRVVQVVSGASNLTAGVKVPFAPAGVRLPKGEIVKPMSVRGVASQGVLCAEDELGLSEDHSGVFLLSPETPPGTALSEALGPPETVLEVDVTWNRPDCLSILGIAREVAALFGCTLRRPSVSLAEDTRPVTEWLRVAVEDPDGCPRYTARVLHSVRIGLSPLWMRLRLSLCGLRPINNIVDITNYVLLECGQPLHAFDYDLISGHQITVRRAYPGESLVTLDGVARTLTADMTVIADARRPIAIAGVMGGLGSGIRDATTRVVLEGAAFDPACIHRTALALNLATESSIRYERGVDVTGVEWCSRRAAALMAEYANACVASGVADMYPRPPKERIISCRYEKVSALYGASIPSERIVSILRSLELDVSSKGAESCIVRVPGFRPDLELEADLMEEVVRLYGMESIPAIPPVVRMVEGGDAAQERLLTWRESLTRLGLTEIVNYSFVSAACLDRFTPEEAQRRVILPNPVSVDQGILRDSLLPGVIETLGRNRTRGMEVASVFEIGRIFWRDGQGAIHEEDRLAIGLMGPCGRGELDRRRAVEPEEMFLWGKGILERLAEAQHMPPFSFEPATHSVLESGQTAAILWQGDRTGVLGLLCRRLCEEYRVPSPLLVAELSLPSLPEITARSWEWKPPSPFPTVRRDVALIAPVHVTHGDILRVLRGHAPPELTHVNLFDIFRSEAIGKGRRSLAYSLVYSSPDRTLTDEEVNRLHQTVCDALRIELPVDIRDT